MRIVGIFLVILLAGCVSSPAYRPFAYGVGFSDAVLGPETISVTYNGTANQSPGEALRLATLRAAEVAFESGKPFFEIESDRSQFVTTIQHQPPYSRFEDYTGRDGRTRTRVYDYPGYTMSNTAPVATLRVKLLDQKSPNALETRKTLQDAIAAGVQFGPRVTAELGSPIRTK